MKNVIKFLILGSIICLLSCSKDKDNDSNCAAENFGVLKVNFGSTTVKHSILITFGPTSAREKIIPAGVSSDTMRLAPGNNYPISVSSLNNADLALETENFIRSITQCQETTVAVDF